MSCREENMRSVEILLFALKSESSVLAQVQKTLQQQLEPVFKLQPVFIQQASAAPHSCTPDGLVLFFNASAWAENLTALKDLRQRYPHAAVLVLGQGLSAGQWSNLLTQGANDFLSYPAPDDELVLRMKRLLGLLPSALPWVNEAAIPTLHSDMLGTSPAFQRVLAQLPALAGCSASVLLSGETGTGKEVFAQAIHYASSRAAGPWVAVNCAAIPADLMEDELFGHVRGAYTHAHTARNGLVAEAEGGTLLLDEIDALPLTAQAKLLRFLQNKEYRRVGCDKVQRANVRVIAASNRHLKTLVAQQQFREDLYFRLHVLAVQLPALRERTEDIALLVRHFMSQAAQASHKREPGLAPLALKQLMHYPWPGNVRELKHVVERAVLMSPNDLLQASDFEIGSHGLDETQTSIASLQSAESFQSAKARAVERFERHYLEQLLHASAGNISEAARHAHKNRRAFFELLRKHEINANEFRAV